MMTCLDLMPIAGMDDMTVEKKAAARRFFFVHANGGTNGLDDRKERWERAKAVLGA